MSDLEQHDTWHGDETQATDGTTWSAGPEDPTAMASLDQLAPDDSTSILAGADTDPGQSAGLPDPAPADLDAQPRFGTLAWENNMKVDHRADGFTYDMAGNKLHANP